MIVTHKLKMDLTCRKNPPRVDVVQDDKYSRNLEITLCCGAQPWEPGDGVSAMVRYVKSDGTGGHYNCLPDDTPACRIAGNVVTAALAPQVCTAAGRVRLAVGLFRDSAELNTFAIELDVHRNPGLQATSRDYYRLSGTVPSSGWEPGMLLGTDEQGCVAAVAPGIRTINGVGPDAEGNLSISVSTLPRPATASAGQYLRVRNADENGNVTSLEAVDPVTEVPLVALGTVVVRGDAGVTLSDADAAALEAALGRPFFLTLPVLVNNGEESTAVWLHGMPQCSGYGNTIEYLDALFPGIGLKLGIVRADGLWRAKVQDWDA